MANKNINFKITAIDATKAAFKNINKGLNVVGSTAAKASMGVAKIGFAATASATALAALVKVNVDFMDKLGKTADKLGIEVEFLQAMRFAAEQTGVKVEALDMGLQRFIRRTAEAAKGTGEAKRAFEMLGIQLKDNNGNLRDIRDIFFEVADGIQNTKSSADKVFLSFKFFDSEGVALVNTLKNGADGLREFEQEAENLGIIISRQSIAKAEMFANSLNVLKKQFTALSANITSAFIPILNDLSGKMTTLLADMKGGETTFENFGKNLAVSILTFMRSAFVGFIGFIDGIQEKLEKFARSKIGQQIFGDLFSEEDKARARFEEMQYYYSNLQKRFMDIDLGGAVLPENMPKRAQELLAEIQRVKPLLIEMSKQFEEVAPEDNPIIKFFDNAIQKVQDFKLEFDKPVEDKLTQDMSEKVSAFVDSIGNTTDAISDLTINTMKNFEDSIIEGLKNGKFAFKDFADFVIEQILRIAIQEAILKPITGKVESFFGGLFGRASGGPVNSGQAYIVGERGPELFVPSGNGNIVPNNQMNSVASGGTTVNFNISTVDAAGFDQLLASRKGLITQIINNAMNNQGKIGIV